MLGQILGLFGLGATPAALARQQAAARQKLLNQTKADINKIEAKLRELQSHPAGAPYIQYLACLKNILTGAASQCTQPSVPLQTVIKTIMDARKTAAAQAKAVAVAQKKAATAAKVAATKDARAAAQAAQQAKVAANKAAAVIKKDERKAAAAQKKADRLAKRLKNGKVVNIAAQDNGKVDKLEAVKDKLAKAISVLRQKVAAKKAKPALRGLDACACKGQKPNPGRKLGLRRRPKPLGLLGMIFGLGSYRSGLGDIWGELGFGPEEIGVGPESMPTDPATGAPLTNPQTAVATLPQPTTTPPKNACIKKDGTLKNSTTCMFYSMALESQQQTFFLIQQIIAMQAELMSLIRELQAGGAGGGAYPVPVDPMTGAPLAVDPYTGQPVGGGYPQAMPIDYGFAPAQPSYDPFSAPMLPAPQSTGFDPFGIFAPPAQAAPAMTYGAAPVSGGGGFDPFGGGFIETEAQYAGPTGYDSNDGLEMGPDYGGGGIDFADPGFAPVNNVALTVPSGASFNYPSDDGMESGGAAEDMEMATIAAEDDAFSDESGDW